MYKEKKCYYFCSSLLITLKLRVMKKINLFLAALAMVAFVACNNAKEETAQEETQTTEEVATEEPAQEEAAETAEADSAAEAETPAAEQK
ncbi:hypothetical protein JCM31826_06100 [Thermaurantimonas aggregans]|uniref:Lipoprotein n=2 Tax=Thermaurantimonas aggregans TaxID=2173829 RepID=A0A401XJG3_9FLAO|nr:hypothetical protein JCM31826_06100 [Thermaurantimonas aggregans]